MKATKAHALKECDPLVKRTRNLQRCFHYGPERGSTCVYLGTEFAECATGRTVSVAWACRSKYKEVQDCISRLYVSQFRSYEVLVLTSSGTPALDRKI